MNTLLFSGVIILIIVLAVVLKIILEKQKFFLPTPSVWPYRLKKYFFTRNEIKFFRALQEAVKDKYIILSKVRIADILDIPKSTDNRRYYWNKIQSKHIDFLICSVQGVRPLIAIELDDYTHKYRNRIKRDNFVNDIFKDAGIPLLRADTKAYYDSQKIAEKIESHIV